MSTVQQDILDKQWYFKAFGQVFGPYKTEDDAYEALELLLGGQQCPTCEE